MSYAGEERRLTPREAEVVVHLRKGQSAPRIAAALGISKYTVAAHIQHIFDKLPKSYHAATPQRAIVWWAYDTNQPR